VLTTMGGWDNHPEYGGPSTTIIVAVILAIAGLVFLALRWKHPLRLSWEQQQYISTQRCGQLRCIWAISRASAAAWRAANRDRWKALQRGGVGRSSKKCEFALLPPPRRCPAEPAAIHLVMVQHPSAAPHGQRSWAPPSA